MNEFSGLIRRCADDYGMIKDGDAIAVGVSGGKDSLLLLCALSHLRSYYPKSFRLEAITLDLGFEGADYSRIARLCAGMDVPYTVIKTDIKEIVFDIRNEKNPCSLCAKLRRGALNAAIARRGIKKLALGHHFDDAVETFLLSLLYEGRLNCFRPVTWMSRAQVFQIRPMLYAREQKIAALVRELDLPVADRACPRDGDSKRSEVKTLLSALETQYPDLKTKIFGAIQRMPLPGWEQNPERLSGG